MQKFIQHVMMTQTLMQDKTRNYGPKPRHYILCEHGTFTGVSKCAKVTKIKYVCVQYLLTVVGHLTHTVEHRN
jgi:hypothetical protein